ncbi:hypothetical protein Nepgr_001537 [Nepenthes gracilis]|uniref:RING-type E3 ubiquitin transferase n=1 Tax=Nepenthes gracilis TaxID=150966 RepID=A0AAD3P5A8_NEPGR|nr:hypothetical protein Nepgr_001537 [Nepenthes gracilis]
MRDAYSILAYVLVILLVALWLLFVFCKCCQSPSSSSSPPRWDNISATPRSTSYGLRTSVVETFPKFAYSEAEGRGGAMASECVVCLGTFEENETLRLIPKCGHVFHAQCVDAWLIWHATCPYCRANLLPQPAGLPSHPGVTIWNAIRPRAAA